MGGGVIGVEYATIFSALDVPVTLIEKRENILEFVDRELVDDFIHQMRDRGMTVRLGCDFKDVVVKPTGVEVNLTDGRMVRTEMLLFAAGRSGNTASLGLDAVGIDIDERGRIKVNPATFQTNVPHIYACGDVIGFRALPRRRWSRAAPPRATLSASRCRPRRTPFPMAFIPCRKFPRSAFPKKR